MNFCSRAAQADIAAIAGTGVRGAAYVFLPVPKRFWGASEFNPAWASPSELDAIKTARAAGVVGRLYNPPAETEAPAIVCSDGASEGVDLLREAFESRWRFEQDERPRLAVCTQGTRDRCCAKWGFAVYREALALFTAGRSPFEPLECSHLGGDRFAATGIFFPSGSMYAHLDSSDLKAVASAEQSGRIGPAPYRGRVFEPMLTQVVRAGLARDGFADEATAALMLSEEASAPGRVRVTTARGAVFDVSLAEVELGFYASCSAMDRDRRSRARRLAYAAAERIS